MRNNKLSTFSNQPISVLSEFANSTNQNTLASQLYRAFQTENESEKSVKEVSKEIIQDKSYDSILGKKIDALLNENWTDRNFLYVRIYHIDKNNVFCDCLLDKENKIFEKRQFSKILFENLNELKEGIYAVVNIYKKAGAMRIDVKDGRDIVNPQDFDLNDIWDFSNL
jgi:hypothetical protein